MRAALHHKNRFTPAPLALAVALSLTLAATAPTHAQTGTPAAAALSINIPAQPLGHALNELARQANLQLSFPAELVAGKTAPAVSGQLTPRQALDRLLAGSDLEASVDGSAVLVKKAPPRTAGTDKELAAVVVSSLRANRVSKGATGLPMEVKETPQSISTFDSVDMQNYGVTGSNQALQMVTGINVEQYETNRATFESRGFEIQLTQMDGLGMTNSWGTVVGQQDTFLFDKIEVIRGANGLLTGVGNASGTVNYVRKRPTNKDEGQVVLEGGSYDKKRVALDYNKVLTEDGTVAGRVVLIHQDKDSWIRSLNDRDTTLYGVIDSQIGSNGVLTVGVTDQDHRQKSPMWGSLTLNYADGSQASFDTSASTSQDWTYWNTKSTTAFAEYTHYLSDNWEGKFTYNKRHAEEETRLLYAYSLSGALNNDNTGLVGWPYGSYTTTDSDLFDLNLSGNFNLFGRKHELITGLSHSIEETDTDTYSFDSSYMLQALPAFPYGGNVYPEPNWGARTPASGGKQTLTRLYGATRLALTDELRAIVGLNSVKLEREGSSRYGSVTTTTEYPDTRKSSPYYGLTYDITGNLLGYLSYSEIFQNQDQTDYSGAYLDPMKGVNREAGLKADWLDKRLLTTFAVFSAKQEGLATYDGMTSAGQYAYVPKDVKSTGFELEATGKIGRDANLALGFTRIKLTGPDGNDIYEWVPRTQVKARFDSAIPGLPALRLGLSTRWNSDVRKNGGARQDAYSVSDAFARYQITPEMSARLNVNNLFNQKYVTGIAYGAVYGEPRSAYLTLDYKL
ncbi:TonB-dependent siderophore receptor [Uliginosibacterium aquaticum]|uniref:TonB-dependent siderophore receptor n=1 Tax=Uliginosibacterium aquaticum TaxID=2731212 RepID=A0ABX2IB92_9RHOO|nr:TonB-dependent receptor [Uliginosibacterium aquaticum]NSL53432.1 TonB-dependent siderophore receptor [Uliginosibacterium aquaticum]